MHWERNEQRCLGGVVVHAQEPNDAKNIYIEGHGELFFTTSCSQALKLLYGRMLQC